MSSQRLSVLQSIGRVLVTAALMAMAKLLQRLLGS